MLRQIAIIKTAPTGWDRFNTNKTNAEYLLKQQIWLKRLANYVTRVAGTIGSANHDVVAVRPNNWINVSVVVVCL